ncbi:MAG TPA: FHA domain-containing protein [Bacteroidia bacterium]|nr:FHA domain-containing protein [Bacteroidia bacterium]
MGKLRILAVVLALLLAGKGPLWSQLISKGESDASKHPTITFKVNDRDPNLHPDDYFKVREAEKELKFDLGASEPNDSGYAKSILIIWEYLPSKPRDAQNKYFRQLILQALPDLLTHEDDKLNIADFAWTGKDDGAKTLNYLGTGFGTDTAALRIAVRDAKSPNGKGIDAGHGSEIYPAISEGVKALAATKSRAKVLIVLSAEFPNIHNQNIDASMATAEARKADVAVYNIRYQQMSEKYSLDNMAALTYGRSYEVKKDALGEATKTLLEFADQSTQRALGMDYTFTVQTTLAKDGAEHPLQLVAGTETLEITYRSPSKSFGEWIGDNVALFVAVLVLLIGCGVGIYLWMRKRKQSEEARQAEEKRKLEEVKARSAETEQRVAQQNQQLSQMQHEEQERQRKAAEAKRKEEAELEAKTLLAEMYANGRQPRVTTMVNGAPLTMDLPSPVTTVGRDASCDIQFNLSTISRTHFQIIYQNGKYMLLDLGSTNGTALNGGRVNQAELRHGDEIKAGEAILHFYI